MKQNFYQKAWKILENITPLKSDCGMLCNGACCKGTVNEGMLLFPDEEKMYAGDEDWYIIKDSNIVLPDGTAIKLFVCNGHCRREIRPLSCRIFPVIPYIDDMDYLEFVPDLRGAAICPILHRHDDDGVSPEFIDALYTAFSSIIASSSVLKFIEMLSNQHDELLKDFKKFYGSD